MNSDTMLDSNKPRAGSEKLEHTKMTGGSAPTGKASLPTANSTKSFWHSDPSKVLLGHRTTESLPTEADVVIIGSGISGASAAHFLREDDRGKDLNIVVLEAREACWGATGRVRLLLSPTNSELKYIEWRALCPGSVFHTTRHPRIRAAKFQDYRSARRQARHPMRLAKSLSSAHLPLKINVRPRRTDVRAELKNRPRSSEASQDHHQGLRLPVFSRPPHPFRGWCHHPDASRESLALQTRYLDSRELAISERLIKSIVQSPN